MTTATEALTPANSLTPEQARSYHEKGYVRLGKAGDDDEIAALRERIDDIMLGKVVYEGMRMQLCPSFGETPEDGSFTNGHKGSTRKYRKMYDLEIDPLFRAYLRKDRFRCITQRLIGHHVAIYRAMFMNKPAGGGTNLNWHQDAGSEAFPELDTGFTIWTALDPATRRNGCVQVIPRSHFQLAQAVNNRPFESDAQLAERFDLDTREYLELEPGEAVLLRNWTFHCSAANKTDQPRRAFAVAYIHGRLHHGDNRFPQVFPEYEPVDQKPADESDY